MGKNLEINPTEKQFEAYQSLNNPKISEIHFGGGAGGGKTWLGCESRLVRALAYPGYKSFIGRKELTRLMATCYLTWQKVCSFHGLKAGTDWKLNGQYHYIEFSNRSRIDLLDLAHQPSDPMYERLGSLEYTDGWIDEAGEVPFMAIDILQSRVGRHMNDEFELPPDTLYTYNPNKGWVYKIYKLNKEGKLPDDTVFIQALYSDNPYTADTYGRQLSRIKDPAMRSRLKEGNFDYDNDPTNLISTAAIYDMLTNTVDKGDKFLTIDVARHGVDKTVFYLWEGLKIYGVRIYEKQATTVTAEKARTLASTERIPYSHCLADEDGIGGAVVDMNKGFQGFIANSPALDNPNTKVKENYANLRSQCHYVMADKINTHKMAIDIKPENFISEVNGLTYEVWIEMLAEELEAVKSKNIDRDVKLRVRDKEEVKGDIGRSPDFSDTMMMRMKLEYPSVLSVGNATITRPSWKGFNRRG